MREEIFLGGILSDDSSDDLYIRYKSSLEYVPVVVGEGKEN